MGIFLKLCKDLEKKLGRTLKEKEVCFIHWINKQYEARKHLHTDEKSSKEKL